MAIRSIRGPRALLVLPLLLLAACGGAKQTAGGTTTPVQAPPPPPIPDEPLQLLPASAQLVGRVDLERLRASPHFPLIERWLTRAACVDANASQWLTQRTSRLALASIGDGGHQWLVVAHGDYRPEDAEQVATLLFARENVPLPAVFVSGRFRWRTGPALSLVQLDDHTFALGDNWSLIALTVVADGKAPNWEQGSAALPDFDNRDWLSGHAGAVLGKPADDSVRRVKAELDHAGAGELGAGLEHSALAFGLSLNDGADISLQVFYAEQGAAERTVDRIHGLLDRMGFVLRLVGIPKSVTHPKKLAAEGSKLEIEVDLARGDVDSMAEKLDAFVPACGG